MLFRKVIEVYSKNCMKSTNTLCEQNKVIFSDKILGIYNQRCVLKFWRKSLVSYQICWTTVVGFLFFFNWYSGGWSPIGSTRHCGHK
jgi:hypothetical protein